MREDKGILHISARMPDTGEDINFYLLTDKKIYDEIPKEQISSDLQQMLKVVSVMPVFGIYNTVLSYGYPEPPQKPTSGNTLIEVNLPYCLHIPNDYEMIVSLPDKGYEAKVFFYKIWTENANGSSLVDVFAENKKTYFQKSEFITPQIPHQPETGWDFKYQGKNVQKIRDGAGVFRYTKLRIYLYTDYSPEKLKNKTGFAIASREIYEKSLDIVSRVLDAYRYATKESHVERLAFLTITDIYFHDSNVGYHPVSPNIEAAIINRSMKEIESIEDMLSSNNKPPLYELLLLSSHSSFEKRMFTLALVESFQALEIFLENFLIEKYKLKSITEADIEQKLNQTWRTKERLKELLRETTGHSLLENRDLWDKWCTVYDKVRNEVIHHGKELSPEDTKQAIKLNLEVMEWVKKL